MLAFFVSVAVGSAIVALLAWSMPLPDGSFARSSAFFAAGLLIGVAAATIGS